MAKNLCFTRLFPLLGVLIMTVQVLPAQDSRDGIFAPFVSRIDAEVNGEEVIITWEDAVGAPELLYTVRRSNRPIVDDLSGSIVLTTVAPGVRRFTDRPAPGIDWWYVVTAGDADSEYDIIIPWRNTTAEAVSVFRGGRFSGERSLIRSFEGDVAGDRFVLSYVADPGPAGIVFLRSPVPFDDQSVIDYAVEIGRSSEASGALEETPLPGISWYYAAMDSGLFDSGSENRLASTVSIGPYVLNAGDSGGIEGVMRPAPLPVLRIQRSVRDGSSLPVIDGILPERQALDPDVSSAIGSILGPFSGEIWEEPSPVVFVTEQADSEDRRQQVLSGIMTGDFADRNWEEAEDALFALSAANGIDERMRARIHFYLGQCQYYRGNYGSAFLSFLIASDEYYPESRHWMLRIYSDLLPVG